MPPGRWRIDRVCRKLVLSHSAGHDPGADVAGAAEARVFLRADLHVGLGRGGLLGYAIGALLYETLGKWLIHVYGYGARVEEVRALYAHWGWAVILIKGMTPIPFKIVTITSGLLAYSLPLFILLSLITRGARFFLVAALLNRYGAPINGLLEKVFRLFPVASCRRRNSRLCHRRASGVRGTWQRQIFVMCRPRASRA